MQFPMSSVRLDNLTKKKSDFVLYKLPPITDVPIAEFMKTLNKLMSTIIPSPMANNSNCNLFHNSCKPHTISVDPTEMYKRK